MCSKPWPKGPAGSTTLRIRSVAAIAKTPSLNASSRFVVTESCCPLHELDDDSIRRPDVQADRAVKRAAGFANRKRASRNDVDAGGDQPLSRGRHIIDCECDVDDRPVVELEPDASTFRPSVFDQLDDASIPGVKVSNVKLDRFEPQQRRRIRVAQCPARHHPQPEHIAIEGKGAIEVRGVDPDVIDSRHGHGCAVSRRSGMRSRAKTSSIVSARLTSSAWSPETSTVAGRGSALKLVALAS